MKWARCGSTVAAVTIAAVVATTTVVGADVRTEEKTLVKFEGMLGRMIGMFGGKAAREGLVSTVAVKGDRKLVITGDSGQLFDLKEEKVYELDMKDKTLLGDDVCRDAPENRRGAQARGRKRRRGEAEGQARRQSQVTPRRSTRSTST